MEKDCAIVSGCQCARRGSGIIVIRELVLWCLTSFSTVFPLYRDDQYELEYPEKTTDLRKSLSNFTT